MKRFLLILLSFLLLIQANLILNDTCFGKELETAPIGSVCHHYTAEGRLLELTIIKGIIYLKNKFNE
jgi:hypothetical protein